MRSLESCAISWLKMSPVLSRPIDQIFWKAMWTVTGKQHYLDKFVAAINR